MARHEKLEQKATVMLSVVAVLAPLVASTTVFIARDPSLDGFPGGFAIVCGVGAMVAVLLAFIASLRTLAVREHQEILIGGLVKGRRVREYSADFRIRGILWAAANREALNDQIADFVRASQMFLGFGVALVLLMSASVLPFMGDADQATVSLDSASIEAAGAAVESSVAPLQGRLMRMEERMDSVSTAAGLGELRTEIETLRSEISEMTDARQLQ